MTTDESGQQKWSIGYLQKQESKAPTQKYRSTSSAAHTEIRRLAAIGLKKYHWIMLKYGAIVLFESHENDIIRGAHWLDKETPAGEWTDDEKPFYYHGQRRIWI